MSDTGQELRIEWADTPAAEQEADGLVLPFFSDEAGDGAFSPVDELLGGVLKELREREEFRADACDCLILPTLGRLPAARLALVGLGKKKEFSPAGWSRAVSAACRSLGRRGASSVAIETRDLGLEPHVAAREAAAGAELARFQADSYKTSSRRDRSVSLLTLLIDGDVAAAVREGRVIGSAKNLARELVNEPCNVITPPELAERAERVAAEHGLQYEILDEERLVAESMGGIVAVSRGSREPPRLIVLRHTPLPGPPALALIGKAVTFDTGGISLKPRENMQAMKGDMAGGAAVIGAMQAIADLQLPVNVVGIIPSAENMPDGRAFKPGDVVPMRGGKNVEIVNTDAEGRMLLADALGYAQSLGAERMVDIATLTGACVVALGNVASGLWGNSQELIDALRAAGEETGERNWPMPLFPEYRSLNRSDIADLKNSAGRTASAVGAAWFLREFVDDRPWAHLDIAGTSWQDKGTAYAPAGPTGTGVGTFVSLARRLSEGGS